MPEFLIELYAPREATSSVALGAERARLGAEELTREGVSVRYVRSIFVPEDETWFSLYEATSVDAVREAALRAGLGADRVLEVRND